MLLAKTIYLSVDGTGGAASNGVAAWSFNVIAEFQDGTQAFGGFMFAEMNTDESGDTSSWTKAQTYLALGNTLHTVARLGLDSTPMEGIDTELVNKEFEVELDGYQCHVALAIGYRHPEDDYNASIPKSRRSFESVFTIL